MRFAPWLTSTAIIYCLAPNSDTAGHKVSVTAFASRTQHPHIYYGCRPKYGLRHPSCDTLSSPLFADVPMEVESLAEDVVKLTVSWVSVM
eukprot:152754-Chlamydomonas_euryale.AAC.14